MDGLLEGRPPRECECGSITAYVREGSYNTLLPATTSEEDEEDPSSDEEGNSSLRRSAKKHGSSSPKKRAPAKVNDEVSCVLVTYSGNWMMRLRDFSCTIPTVHCQASGHWFPRNLQLSQYPVDTASRMTFSVNVNHISFANIDTSVLSLRS